MLKRILALLLMLVLFIAGAHAEILVEDGVVLFEDEMSGELLMVEYGQPYSIPEEVALYLYVFCVLPENFITKNDAQALGWVSSKGNLWDVAYGCSIGGDRFGNREGLLPKAKGRNWFECDVNYEGGFRGSERILFSNDGLIYYTNDHYATFTCLYDGWYMDGIYGEEYADAAA